MFYLGLWIKILRYYLVETSLLLLASLLLFFVFLDSGEFELLQNKLWPKFQSDYYFTLVIDTSVPTLDIERMVSQTSGVSSASVIDSEKVQKKLRKKLLEKKVYLNSEAIIKDKTYVKVFLDRSQDISIMPIIKRRFLEKLSAYKYQSSSVKTLRKGLDNNQTISFLRQWSDFILKTFCSLLWLIIAIVYSMRTKKFLLLCEKFKFENNLRSKVFISQVSLSLIFIILLKNTVSIPLEPSSVLASVFLLLGICGLYHLWVSRSRLDW